MAEKKAASREKGFENGLRGRNTIFKTVGEVVIFHECIVRWFNVRLSLTAYLENIFLLNKYLMKKKGYCFTKN